MTAFVADVAEIQSKVLIWGLSSVEILSYQFFNCEIISGKYSAIQQDVLD